MKGPPPSGVGPGDPRSQGRESPPLGTLGEIRFGDSENSTQSGPPKSSQDKDLRRAHRKDFAMQCLESDTQASCGLKRVPRRNVEYYESDRTGDCYSRGIATCGSVWCCPVCSRRVARVRGDELQRAVNQHLEAGGGVHMLTATLPHHAGHSLEEVYEAVTESWRYVKNGGPWQRKAEEIGYIGAVRGTDATHGPNGWHPHIHVLLFLEEPLGEDGIEELERWIFERWRRKVRAYWKDGRTGELRCRSLRGELPRHHEPVFGDPSPEHAIRVSESARSGDRAGEYVAKMGLGKEATSMIIKGGKGEHRTPWQILLDYVAFGRQRGSRDHALWAEWITTMKGKVSLYWSPGLRDRFELEEEPDPQVDAFEGGSEEDRRIATVHRHLWDKLTRNLYPQEKAQGLSTWSPEELDNGLRMVFAAGGVELGEHYLKECARDAGVDPARVGYQERDRVFYLLAERWQKVPRDQEEAWLEEDSCEDSDLPGIFDGI